MDIPYGCCHCGCGEKTKIATQTITKYAQVKGEPMRFVAGHFGKGLSARNGHKNPRWRRGARVRPDGYLYIYMPDHPRASRNYVMEHILFAEKALGKPLPAGAEVHHVNGIRYENYNNLVICEDSEYHKLIHRRTRALEACGRADWLKCVFCKQHDEPQNIITNIHGGHFHRSCELKYQRQRRAKKRTEKDDRVFESPVSRFVAEMSQ